MNSFGRAFRIGIFGESHGTSIGITIDGCPAGLSLKAVDFEEDLSKRRSGVEGTTERSEADAPSFISGMFGGKTTGAPLTVLFENANLQSGDYDFVSDTPRPGHADFVAAQKFGNFNDYRGGGQFSGRLTLALVAAGVVARKAIHPITVSSRIVEVGGQENSRAIVQEVLREHDSVGGIIECTAKGVPVGLGEPFFDSVESLVSHLVFSIPAVRGIEFGAGFAAARMKGSEHNDEIVDEKGTTDTNNAGGINGGITNGNDLCFRIAVKPSSSIGKTQRTYSFKEGKKVEMKVSGRHDTCIALRTPVIVESALAIVLADLCLIEQRMARTMR